MTYLVSALIASLTGGMTFRWWYRRRRQRRIEARRRVEAPNSHYSSALVREQLDRERWGGIALGGLHPLNREEVLRLLDQVDEDGVRVLSPRDRLFLDNMTLPRMGI
jgi:Flp pilus assembly protein TadB